MPARRRRARPSLVAIGWREWVALPELGIDRIKAKVDTGARTSSLHASRITAVDVDGTPHIRFEVHPYQRSSRITVTAVAPLLGYRHVRSSSGHGADRPVVTTTVELMGQRRAIELTLVARDEMGFRMLLGREAIRGAFAVDTGRSYLGNKQEKAADGA
jgi:hypothetical protein